MFSTWQKEKKKQERGICKEKKRSYVWTGEKEKRGDTWSEEKERCEEGNRRENMWKRRKEGKISEKRKIDCVKSENI